MLNNPQFAFSLLKPGTHEVDNNKTLSEPWKTAPTPLLFR